MAPDKGRYVAEATLPRYPTLDAPAIDGEILAEEKQWLNTPGSENLGGLRVPARPGQTGEIRANVTKQYAAAGYINWFTNWTRILPFAIDDLTQDFGLDLYLRMMLDPAVITGVNVFRTSVLQDGAHFYPAIRDKDQGQDGEYELSVKINNECQEMWHNMESPPDQLLWNLEEACAVGNKAAEMMWQKGSTPDGRTVWQVRRIVVKPQISVAYATDVYGDIVGLLGLVPGIGYPVQIGTLLTEPDRQPNLLPREKFMLRIFRPRDNDPRGTSLIRPAYTAWNMKMQLWGEYLKWLAQFATPSIIGFTSPSALPVPLSDDIGNPVLDGGGNQIMVSPQQDMANTLADMKNSTVSAFANGAEVKVIEMHGQGAPFQMSIRLLNEEITQAISHQPLTTQASQYGTRAQAGVHKDVQDTIVKTEKKAVARMIKFDFCRKYVRYNYGTAALHLVPHVSMGESDETDFAPLAAGVAALQTAGYLDVSQYPLLDAKMNLPQRLPGWEDRMKAAAAAQVGQHSQGQSDNPTGARNAA